MMYVCAMLISALVIQTIQITISPTALKAMATLQTHRAKAIANALRARAHYNAALARTNLGLLDRRVVRDSDAQLENEPQADYDEEDGSVEEDLNVGEYEDLLNPEFEEDSDRPLPLTTEPENGENAARDSARSSLDIFSPEEGPEMSCVYSSSGENSIPEENSIGSRGLDGGIDWDSGNRIQKSNGGDGNQAVGCQRPTDESQNQEDKEPIDQTLGAQQPFQPGLTSLTTNQQQFPQQIFVPMPFLPQGVPTMQLLPQGNYPLSSLTPYQPGFAPTGFGPHMFLVGQKPPQNDKNEDSYALRSSQRNDDAVTAPEPHLRPFVHSHTFTHTHSKGFEEPFHGVPIPNTQVVAPGVNVNVVQNQNAAVTPTVPIHQGFSVNTGRTLVQINPGGSVYHPVPPPTFIPSQGVNLAGQPTARIVPRPGTGISQSQSIQTSGVPNTVGGSSFAQTQAVIQGRRSDSNVVGTELTDQPIEDSENQMAFPDPGVAGVNGDNEKVGTFMTGFTARAPESPENFDPNRPQNLQPVVNYIEGRQDSMRRMIHSIQRNENLVHHAGVPKDLHNEFEYVNSPNQYEYMENKRFKNELVGSFPLDNIHIRPVPTLPGNFLEESPEEQRESVLKYLEEERRNVQDFLEQVENNNRRNLNSLSNLIDTDSAFLPDPLDFQRNLHDEHKEEEENISDTLSELTGNFLGEREMNDEEMDDMLARYIEDHSAMKENDEPSTDSNLGQIIDVPLRRESEWVRFVRSLNQTNTEKLDQLLSAEREVINELKKDAKHDEDLMMIGYIGENIIKDLEKRRDETKRTKREISGRSFNLPLNRLMTDPKTKLDIPKTIDNLGAIAKNSFEHENAPLYHVRNMVGSAQDAVLATMKIPTKNFLIPSQYDIVNMERDNPLMGEMNPRYFPQRNLGEQLPNDEISNTFQTVGSAIRSGVLSGQEALNHVGEAANHAKNAIHSTKYVAPRLMLKQVPAITREPRKQTVLITPRIFDITSEDGQVGQMLDNSQARFIKVGHILDAVGVSNPNSDDVRFEKIIVEPKGTIFGKPETVRPSQKFQNFLQSIKMGQFNEAENEKEIILGNTLNSLQNIRDTLGVGSLKDFFTRMKEDLKEFFYETQDRDQMESRNKTVTTHDTQTADQAKNQVDQNQGIVEATLIPENLVHPFMGQISDMERDRLWKEANAQNLGADQSQRDKDLGSILGSINPMMFQRIFNESLRARSNDETPYSVFHHHHDGHSHGFHEAEDQEEDEEDLGTSMKLNRQMLTPFMGQASNKAKHDFFRRFMPDGAKSSEESNEYGKDIPIPEMIDIVDGGNGLEY